jgi:hypothetical protein
VLFCPGLLVHHQSISLLVCCCVVRSSQQEGHLVDSELLVDRCEGESLDFELAANRFHCWFHARDLLSPFSSFSDQHHGNRVQDWIAQAEQQARASILSAPWADSILGDNVRLLLATADF